MVDMSNIIEIFIAPLLCLPVIWPHNPCITSRKISGILPDLAPRGYKYVAPTFPVFHTFSFIKSGQAGRIFDKILKMVLF